jgi:hypothetical protein
MRMKRLIIRCVIALFATSITAGCVTTTTNYQRETASYITKHYGGVVSPELVRISDVHKVWDEVRWKAETIHSNYDCSADDSADDMLRHVSCIEGE